MKKIILILLATIMLLACEEKRKIEIIPNYDIQYYSEKNVKTPAIPKDSALESKLNTMIVELIKSISEKEGKNIPGLFPYWRLYINKNGNIDLIKDLGPKHLGRIYHDKEITFSKNIISQLLSEMEQWEFTPAILSGEYVKSYIDLSGTFVNTPDGPLKILQPIKFNSDGNKYADYFVAVEQMPEPIGGIKAIQENIRYPEIAKRAGIEGRVFVKAYIDSTGTVAKTELIRGIGAGCDEAAMEAVKKVMFKPGLQRGKRVNVQVTVPILFKLDESVQKTDNSDQNHTMKITEMDGNMGGLTAFQGRIVTMKEGFPIESVKISLKNTKYSFTTDQYGGFYFLKIPSGEYQLVLISETYGKYDLGKIKLNPDKNSLALIEISPKTKNSSSKNEILSIGYNEFENGGKCKVEGKVVSAEDGSPIVAANLFLEGTKFGCSTHLLGEFFVTNIPPGEYDLQFSHPDYGQQKLGKIKVQANKSLTVEIKVKTK